MKKSITYLAVFLIILVIYELCFNYLKSGHEINYILKNDDTEYNITETYSRDYRKDVYIIKVTNDDFSYVFSVRNDYNKRKNIVKKVNEYIKDDTKCLNLELVDTKYSETICRSEDNLYSYNYLKDKLQIEELDYYLEKYPEEPEKMTYDVLTINPLVFEKNEYFIFHLPKEMVFFHPSANVTETFKFATNDNYKNTYGHLVGKYYVIPRIINKPEFYDYLVYDIEKNKLDNITLGTPISVNSYYNGDYNNELYITDRSNLRQYKLNPGTKKVELVATVEEKAYIFNKEKEERVSIYNLIDNYVYFSEDSKAYSKLSYDAIYEQDDYAYFVKDGTFYKVYKMYPDIAITLFSATEPRNIRVVNDTIYFIEDNKVRKYNNKGTNLIMTFNELSSNYENSFDIYVKE